MTDLRTLLHESAPQPTSPLDMEAVYRRARGRRTRRLAGWLGLLGVTLGLGVPGGSVLVTADDGDRGQATGTLTTMPGTAVDASNRSTTSTSTTSTTSVTPATTRPIGSTAGASSALLTPTEAPAVGSPFEPTNDGAAQTTSTTGPPPRAGAYPRAASCSVDNAGLESGEQRSCRFTATAAGGASRRPYGDEMNSPQGQVLVTRNGTTTAHPVVGVNAFAGDLQRGCEELFIQPGDLVEVILTNSANGSAQVETIGAGEHWECYGDE